VTRRAVAGPNELVVGRTAALEVVLGVGTTTGEETNLLEVVVGRTAGTSDEEVVGVVCTTGTGEEDV
jgi:hypothetical protein